MLLIGWDWASTSHAVTVLDAAGAVVGCWTVGHTEHDLDTLLARLAAYDDPAALPVAIERAEGLVVDRLIAAGHPVVPGAFHAARPRWGAAGAKSDSEDVAGEDVRRGHQDGLTRSPTDHWVSCLGSVGHAGWPRRARTEQAP